MIPSASLFVLGLLLAPVCLPAQTPARSVTYGRTTLSGGRENEMLDLLGIEANELTANINTPVYGVRLRIDVWEPGHNTAPRWSETYGQQLRFKEKTPLSCLARIYFFPSKLKDTLPANRYPASLVLQLTRGGEYAPDNPTQWSITSRLAFPENYLSLESCTLSQSPDLYEPGSQAFDRPIPFFHYCASHGSVMMRDTPEATRQANPQAVHIIGWLEPVLEENRPAQTQRTPMPPAAQAASLLPAGAEAPAFELERIEGGKFSSRELAGKITVLNFWTSWCGHCRAEMPGFAKLQEKYGPKGVQFIGLNLDRDMSLPGLRRFVKWNFIETPLNYPLLLLPASLQEQWGKLAALPTTFLIDRQGKIVESWTGEATQAALEAKITRLLAP